MGRSLQMVDLDPKTLRANPWNTNIVAPDAQAKLEASVERHGLFKPILARELEDGTLEVLGGEHRWQAAMARGFDTVPVVNLGRIGDREAKEISLLDNGRYGSDDTLRLAELLESLGDTSDLSTFMPFTDADMESIFSAVKINVDDLELDDELPPPAPSTPVKTVQEFQLLRFKVPVEDAAAVQEKINAVMRAQGFTKDDSLTNAGMALVHICKA